MLEHAELARKLPKFDPGQVVATPGALVALTFNGFSPIEMLHRHLNGDWGDVSPEDKALNGRAIEEGGRILSAYQLAGGERLWIVTKADRSATTLLLPEES